jgi:hypothetical protein
MDHGHGFGRELEPEGLLVERGRRRREQQQKQCGHVERGF